MLTDLVEIRRLGEKKREENLRFRRHLKTHGLHERRFRHIAQEIEDQIDCTVCANCCKVATARVTERDAERLARHLRVKKAVFLRDYCEESGEEGIILRRNEAGCVFLSGTECTVYDERPASCRDFPHLVRGAASFVARMWEMPDRACYCPIVYNALERLKVEAEFGI
ncbi:MAG: YkgJ family cysteine cluster protein [Acidobacteria bacterium]|nr:YkgJ family cysteine cluster protein [Acidobacteriota bacterium]